MIRVLALTLILLTPGILWAQPQRPERNVARAKATLAQALTEPIWKDGEKVATLGRVSAGDAGGNNYIYHSSGWSGLSSPDGVGHYIRIGSTDAYLEAENKLIADARQFGAVGDGTTDDTTAIQAILNSSAKVKRLPSGTYRVTSTLTCDQEGASLIGDSRGDTIIQFDLNDTASNGLRWTNPEGFYALNNRIENITFQEQTLRSDVQDIISIEDPSRLLIKNCNILGGARYGIFMESTINTSLENVRSEKSGVSCLYVADSPTSTSLSCDKCYFASAQTGPNVDINVIGASFDNCILESCLTDYGLQVRGGFAAINNTYCENNGGGDIIVGTGSGGARAYISNFSSISGPYVTDPEDTEVHIYADQYCDQLTIFGARVSVMPKSIQIHPDATQVLGMGIDWGVNEPEMTDASDIFAKGGVQLWGTESSNGLTYFFGRADSRARYMYPTTQLRAADGSQSVPILSFSGDTDTGLYRISADRLGVSLGNSTKLNWSSALARFLSDRVSVLTLGLEERTSDPSNPSEGQATIWQSDGTGTGDDGDVLMKVTAASSTTTHYLTNRAPVGHAQISVEDNVTATTVSSTQTDWSAKSQFTGFTANASEASGATPDHTNDHITITDPGVWEVQAVLTLSGSVASDLWELAFFVDNGSLKLTPKQGVNIIHAGFTYSNQVTVSGLATFAENDTVELWVQRTNGTGTLTITNAVMTAKKVSD